MDFGNMDTHLAEQQASVIFLSFGFNESFKGEQALEGFINTYEDLLERLSTTNFDGRGPARPVVIAPLRTEPLPRGLASPDHAALGPYSAAIRELAQQHEIPVVDLYEGIPAYRAAQGVEERFTFNGIHVTETGDYHVAWAMLAELGLAPRPHALIANASQNRAENFFLGVVEDLALTAEGGTLDLRWDRLPAPANQEATGAGSHEALGIRVHDLTPGSYRLHWGGEYASEHTAAELAEGVHLAMTPAHASAEALRQVVIEKNTLFFDRWRAVNGYYIYGGRKQPFGVVSFPPEMNRFDELVHSLEADIRERVNSPVRATLTIEALSR